MSKNEEIFKDMIETLLDINVKIIGDGKREDEYYIDFEARNQTYTLFFGNVSNYLFCADNEVTIYFNDYNITKSTNMFDKNDYRYTLNLYRDSIKVSDFFLN